MDSGIRQPETGGGTNGWLTVVGVFLFHAGKDAR
jgi:hypothetical protein